MRVQLTWGALWACLASLLFVSPLQAAVPSSAAQLDRYLQARASLGHFGGAVLVAENGKLLLAKGYGMASRSPARANSINTRFLTASITKQFTAVAVLKLRDSGKLTLDDRLCDWIERCPQSWAPITLRQVLGHRSGIWDYESALDIGNWDSRREWYCKSYRDSGVSPLKIAAVDTYLRSVGLLIH